MKRSSYEQFAIVHADSASLFNEQLNEEIFRLRDYHPVVHFSESIPFYAQIKYTVTHSTPECLGDEYELQGVTFACALCPHFLPAKTRKGEDDKRCKVGDCSFDGNEFGRAFNNSDACDHLYELIKEGKVKLCFTE